MSSTLVCFLLYAFYAYNSLVNATWNNSVRILVLLPEKKGNFYYAFGMEKAGAAVSIAIDHLKSNGIINGIDLREEYVNTMCNDVHAIGTASKKLNEKKFHVVIGSQCSSVCSHVCRMATYFNIPCFSGVCQDTEMLQKVPSFRTLTRFIGTFDKVGLGVNGLMEAFKWTRIGIIYQNHTDKIWKYTKEAVKEITMANDHTVAISKSYDATGNESIKVILEEVAKHSRVIILAVRGETLRTLMIAANEMGMTNGDYMFVCVYYYLQKNTFGDISWKQNDQYDDKAKEAYKSILFFGYFIPRTQQYSKFSQEVKDKSQLKFNYSYQNNEEVPYPAANLYEAMYMYGVSLNETLENGEDPLNGTLVSTRIWGRTFTGITGNITLNNNGDRQQGYKIEQISPGNNFELQVVGYFFTNIGHFQPHKINSIQWPGGGTNPPLDHPPCGYSGEYCHSGFSDTERLKLVIGSLVGVLVLLLSISIIAPRIAIRKAKARAREEFWRIKEYEITLNKRSMWSLSRLSLRTDFSQQPVPAVLTGYYKGILVCIKKYENVENKIDPKEFRQLKELDHTNVVKTFGFCIDPPKFFVISEYTSKGTLMDVLENDDINLDWDFRYCLLWDVMRGLEYLFGSSIRFHGNLKSSNCVVDSRFVLKLKDFGPRRWISDKERYSKDLLWTAPEILRLPVLAGSAVLSFQQIVHADMYSLAIIMHELALRNGPFGIETLEMSPDNAPVLINITECKISGVVEAQDLVKPRRWTSFYSRVQCPSKVANLSKCDRPMNNLNIHIYGINGINTRISRNTIDVIEKIKLNSVPFRPNFENNSCPKIFQSIIQKCWDEEPTNRPSLKTVMNEIDTVTGSKKKVENFFDNLLKRMEQYATNLEGIVEERTSKYLHEKRKAEDLLHRLLPKCVAQQIQTRGYMDPEFYDNVSIMFTDIVQFTALSAESTPLQIVEMLNDLYSRFDDIINEYDVYKVETIGDAYMCVSGLPQRNTDHHREIGKLAKSMMQIAERFVIPHKYDRHLQLRVGIHSGSCVAGVIGVKMPRYCLFGDTVNTASRMESSSEASKIQISEQTYELLSTDPSFVVKPRGEVFIKGKGNMRTYWLEWNDLLISYI